MIEEEGNFLDPQCIPDLSGIGRVVKAQKNKKLEARTL
jgi:hypothetical protein